MKSDFRFKHLYGTPQKENWTCIKPNSTTCDSNLIKGNSKYVAFSYHSTGGGVLCILDYAKYGK